MLTPYCSFKARQQYHVIAVVVIMLPAIHGVQHYQDESRTFVNAIVQGQVLTEIGDPYREASSKLKLQF